MFASIEEISFDQIKIEHIWEYQNHLAHGILSHGQTATETSMLHL